MEQNTGKLTFCMTSTTLTKTGTGGGLFYFIVEFHK